MSPANLAGIIDHVPLGHAEVKTKRLLCSCLGTLVNLARQTSIEQLNWDRPKHEKLYPSQMTRLEKISCLSLVFEKA